MKIFVFIFILSLSLQADWLNGINDRCIDEYYYKSGTLNYKRSDNQTWYEYTSNNREARLYDGFKYDSSTGRCSKTQYLGLTPSQYNFLYALVGLFFGFMLFWMVPKK